LVVHDVRQAAFVPQTYGLQLVGVAATQAPVPLHACAGVKTTPAHVAAAQVVPAAYSRHAPAPSHIPSVPQPMAPLSVQ
jgi:hypothetical protein